MTNNRKKTMRLILKWIVISLVILIAYSISVTGGAGKAKPILLIPILIALSTSENELISGIFGAICGLLVDLSCGKLFGFNGVIFLLVGVFSSLLFLHLMRKNILNVIVLTVVAAVIQGLLDFFFYYVMWKYEGTNIVFMKIILPSVIFTTIASPFVYLIIKYIIVKFAEPDGVIVENTSLKGIKG